MSSDVLNSQRLQVQMPRDHIRGHNHPWIVTLLLPNIATISDFVYMSPRSKRDHLLSMS